MAKSIQRIATALSATVVLTVAGCGTDSSPRATAASSSVTAHTISGTAVNIGGTGPVGKHLAPGTILVRDTGNTRTIVSTVAGSQGAWSVTVPPGEYLIVRANDATGGTEPDCLDGAKQVTVANQDVTGIEISCQIG